MSWPGRAPVSSPLAHHHFAADDGGDKAIRLLDEAATVGGKVVGEFGGAELQALQVDDVHVALHARAQDAAVVRP